MISYHSWHFLKSLNIDLLAYPYSWVVEIILTDITLEENIYIWQHYQL